MKHVTTVFILAMSLILGGCQPAANYGQAAGSDSTAGRVKTKADFSPKAASAATSKAQNQARLAMPKDDGRDLDFASRGFIATLDNPQVLNAKGNVVIDLQRYDFVKGEAPDTVNPGLWRHVQLLKKHGLFKVAEGVYQVRGIDAANMTVLEGKTGWIIIDALYNVETAEKALGLLNKYLGERPVTGVIYTHSHADHSGGVRGLIREGDDVPVLAPEHLIEETMAEFLMAGTMMGRRASYQFGTSLKPGPQGIVSGGIVIDANVGGTVSLIEPTDYITTTGETRVIDGVTLEFQMVPETEAPAEMNIFLPAQRVFFASEFVSCTMHNVQTPRGALVRNSLRWAGFITEALDKYADRSDAMMTGHCWPRFGTAEVKKHLRLQRDMYKYIHDQVVRRLNNGETAHEIADTLKLPKEIADEWSTNPYYGTLRHNAKGVYQWYVGWWDGNPAHLNMHPPVEQGKRYVAAIGGADKLLAVAEQAMADGDYRWSAELLSHLVFAQPENDLARAKMADTLEQLGYQTTSAIWRNYYLSGTQELRGYKASSHPQDAPDLVRLMPVESFLELVASRINPNLLVDRALTINIEFSDPKVDYMLTLGNGVLVHRPGILSESADITVKASKFQLMGFFLKQAPLEALEAQGMTVSGNRRAWIKLQQAVEIPANDFSIIVP